MSNFLAGVFVMFVVLGMVYLAYLKGKRDSAQNSASGGGNPQQKG